MRACKQAQALCAVVSFDLPEAIRNVLKSGLPVNSLPDTTLLEHRRRQAVVTVERFIRETVTVGNPAFVDFFVFKRQHTQHAIIFDLNNQVCASRIMRADRLAARQLPCPGAVTKGLACQCAHRAQVNHVAREFGVHRHADKSFDFGVLTPVGHAEFHHAGNLLTKTNASGAMNAATHFLHRNERAGVFLGNHALFFVVARCAAAIANSQVLQLAFTALIADWAIERVVDQQKLHHTLLGLDGFLVFGMHDHALGNRRGTRRHWLGSFLDIDQTHAAIRCNTELFVITKMRNIGAGLLGRVHHRASFNHFDLLAVKFYFNHMCSFESSGLQ